MGSFGLLQNGTFSQNSYAYLGVGLIEILHYEVYEGIFLVLILVFFRMHRLRYIENVCATSQTLMGI